VISVSVEFQNKLFNTSCLFHLLTFVTVDNIFFLLNSQSQSNHILCNYYRILNLFGFGTYLLAFVGVFITPPSLIFVIERRKGDPTVCHPLFKGGGRRRAGNSQCTSYPLTRFDIDYNIVDIPHFFA
jgi:hypothetical protein